MPSTVAGSTSVPWAAATAASIRGGSGGSGGDRQCGCCVSPRALFDILWPGSVAASARRQPIPSFDYDEIDDLEVGVFQTLQEASITAIFFENLLNGTPGSDPFGSPRSGISGQGFTLPDFWARVAALFRRDGHPTGVSSGFTVPGAAGVGVAGFLDAGHASRGGGGGTAAGVSFRRGRGGGGPLYRGVPTADTERHGNPDILYNRYDDDDDDLLEDGEGVEAQVLTPEEVQRLTGKVLDEKVRRAEEEDYERARVPVSPPPPLIDMGDGDSTTSVAAQVPAAAAGLAQVAASVSSLSSSAVSFTTGTQDTGIRPGGQGSSVGSAAPGFPSTGFKRSRASQAAAAAMAAVFSGAAVDASSAEPTPLPPPPLLQQQQQARRPPPTSAAVPTAAAAAVTTDLLPVGLGQVQQLSQPGVRASPQLGAPATAAALIDSS
ncbi:hypothetical protein HK405_006847, partial [Cladochytrium tenue]